jgi:serine protease Do
LVDETPEEGICMRKKGLTLFATGVVLVACSAFQSNRVEPRSDTAANARPVTGQISPTGNVVSYADTVDRVAPAVVTIHAARRVRAPQQFQFQDDDFFNRFFGRPNPQQRGDPNPPSRQERGLGSGVIVRADGYILTNFHVVDGAEDISVNLIDRRDFKAKLVGADKPSDLAVLKIDATQLPVLEPGDSDRVRVGDICLAVGNPLGIGESVTAGIISAKGRFTGISDGSFEDFLQTDAPINQGNSGGALVNTRGELIGINSQILTPTGGNIGIGFAIPSNMAKNVMTQLISTGKVSRGQLGVTVQMLTSDLASGLGLQSNRGVLVSNVTSGGAADRAGIKSGDVILEVNGTPVNEVNALRNLVAAAGGGQAVTLVTLRDGNRRDVKVTLGEFADGRSATAPGDSSQAPGASGRLGVTVGPVTPELAGQFNLPSGTAGLVVTSVDPGGPAAAAGIRAGDVIQSVNRQPVSSTADVQSALAKLGNRPAILQVLRGGQSIFVAVRVR